MRPLLGLLIATLSLTAAHGAVPTYRSMAVESDGGAFFEVYFDRATQAKGILTLWAFRGRGIAKKCVFDTKGMRVRLGDDPFEDIAPGSVLEEVAQLWPKLQVLNVIKPPIFRREGGSGGKGSIYYEDFQWDGPKSAMYQESKDADRAILWTLTWDDSSGELKHTLMRAECRLKSKKWRFTHGVMTTYDKPNNRDLITVVAEYKEGWAPLLKGSNVWKTVYGE